MAKIAVSLTGIVAILALLQVFEVYEDANSNRVGYLIGTAKDQQAVYEWLIISPSQESENPPFPIEFYLDRHHNMNLLQTAFHKYYAHNHIKKLVSMMLWGLCSLSWLLVEYASLRHARITTPASSRDAGRGFPADQHQ